MQALPHMWRMSVEEQRLAQECLRQAIDLDPEYAHAHALLGWEITVARSNLDARMPIGEFTDKALEAGNRAGALMTRTIGGISFWVSRTRAGGVPNRR